MSDTYTPWRLQPPPMEVAGRLVSVPHLKDAPPAEKERYLRDFVNHVPQGPLPPPVSSPPPPEPAERKVFDPLKDLAGLGYRTEWFPMPSGGEVCIHPLSPEETAWINFQAHQSTLEKSRPRNETEYSVQWEFWLKCWHVVACCKRGEAMDAPRVFGDEHAEYLFRSRTTETLVDEISRKSDQLGGKDDAQARAIRGFFGHVENWLRTFATGLNTRNLEEKRADLIQFATSVGYMKRPYQSLTNQALLASASIEAPGTVRPIEE